MVNRVSRQRSRQPDPDVQFDPHLVAALTGSGQRLTRHRAAVVKALETADRPLSVDEVVERADMPTSTGYRNLSELVEAGIAVRVVGADRTDRFELAERFSHRHHHHLVCERCGDVADFDTSLALEQAIEREVVAIASRVGFVTSTHVFDIRGRCERCVTA